MIPRSRRLRLAAGIMLVAIGWTLREQVSAFAQGGATETPYDPALIAQGRELALIGNCNSCHTAKDRPPLAGGRALSTPFGTIHSTNITPDPATGIGAWSLAEFTRAMREGVDKEGRNLYPVFPYDHYTHVTDEDIRALYAYLMTRDAVRARAPRNQVVFPANLRPL